jgi:molecular chaperone GrpE
MADEAINSTENETPETEAAPEVEVAPVVEIAPEVDPLEAAQAEAADWKARAYRAAADIDNLKKRHIKDRSETRKYASQNLVRDLLPVMDNLERAVEHAPDPDGALAQGVQMVLRQFKDGLKSHGAYTFEAKGEPFDPQIHEAMSQMPTDEVEPGCVAQVFQRGWYLHDRLVRPAMVIVGMAMPEPAPEAAPPAAEEGVAGDTQPYQAVFAEAVEAVEAVETSAAEAADSDEDSTPSGD